MSVQTLMALILTEFQVEACGVPNMKPRDVGLRLKRFEMEERERKVATIEMMVTDFKHMASDLGPGDQARSGPSRA